MTYSDSDIQQDISAELKSELRLRDDDIAVGVRDGIVTLGGFVDSWAEKGTAERAAERVSVEAELVRSGHDAHPVAPNRSVLTRSGGYPSATSADATVSTNAVGPQTNACAPDSAGHATSRRSASSTRRA